MGNKMMDKFDKNLVTTAKVYEIVLNENSMALSKDSELLDSSLWWVVPNKDAEEKFHLENAYKFNVDPISKQLSINFLVRSGDVATIQFPLSDYRNHCRILMGVGDNRVSELKEALNKIGWDLINY